MPGQNRRSTVDRYRALAPHYDPAPLRPLRERAVARLNLRPGQTVLDVGCGTGGSFPLIQARIGPGGRIVGIDLSPDMLDRALEQIERNGWRNVTLIPSAVEDADPGLLADAVLFSLTSDILRSPAAIAHVLRDVRPGGRLVAAGITWSPWWALLTNLVTWYRSRPYIASFEGFGRPWEHLAPHLDAWRIEYLPVGRWPVAARGFVLSGTIAPACSPTQQPS
jgi:ubiquinone/menaquinone biosynthesis C-methylase UbiE